MGRSKNIQKDRSTDRKTGRWKDRKMDRTESSDLAGRVKEGQTYERTERWTEG